MGEIIGAIVAETEAQARRAARAVKVTYEALPVITTIEVGITENGPSVAPGITILTTVVHIDMLQGNAKNQKWHKEIKCTFLTIITLPVTMTITRSRLY